MRRIYVIAVAAMFSLNSVNAGVAQERLAPDECIKCAQNYFYICTQNYGECIEACGSVATIDKNACRLRCITRNQGCGERAAVNCGTCKPERLATPPPRHIQ